jgi:hypothetical protein
MKLFLPLGIDGCHPIDLASLPLIWLPYNPMAPDSKVATVSYVPQYYLISVTSFGDFVPYN